MKIITTPLTKMSPKNVRQSPSSINREKYYYKNDDGSESDKKSDEVKLNSNKKRQTSQQTTVTNNVKENINLTSKTTITANNINNNLNNNNNPQITSTMMREIYKKQRKKSSIFKSEDMRISKNITKIGNSNDNLNLFDQQLIKKESITDSTSLVNFNTNSIVQRSNIFEDKTPLKYHKYLSNINNDEANATSNANTLKKTKNSTNFDHKNISINIDFNKTYLGNDIGSTSSKKNKENINNKGVTIKETKNVQSFQIQNMVNIEIPKTVTEKAQKSERTESSLKNEQTLKKELKKFPKSRTTSAIGNTCIGSKTNIKYFNI